MDIVAPRLRTQDSFSLEKTAEYTRELVAAEQNVASFMAANEEHFKKNEEVEARAAVGEGVGVNGEDEYMCGAMMWAHPQQDVHTVMKYIADKEYQIKVERETHKKSPSGGLGVRSLRVVGWGPVQFYFCFQNIEIYWRVIKNSI